MSNRGRTIQPSVEQLDSRIVPAIMPALTGGTTAIGGVLSITSDVTTPVSLTWTAADSVFVDDGAGGTEEFTGVTALEYTQVSGDADLTVDTNGLGTGYATVPAHTIDTTAGGDDLITVIDDPYYNFASAIPGAMASISISSGLGLDEVSLSFTDVTGDVNVDTGDNFAFPYDDYATIQGLIIDGDLTVTMGGFSDNTLSVGGTTVTGDVNITQGSDFDNYADFIGNTFDGNVTLSHGFGLSTTLFDVTDIAGNFTADLSSSSATTFSLGGIAVAGIESSVGGTFQLLGSDTGTDFILLESLAVTGTTLINTSDGNDIVTIGTAGGGILTTFGNKFTLLTGAGEDTVFLGESFIMVGRVDYIYIRTGSDDDIVTFGGTAGRRLYVYLEDGDDLFNYEDTATTTGGSRFLGYIHGGAGDDFFTIPFIPADPFIVARSRFVSITELLGP